MKNLAIIIILTVLFWSCDKPIDLDLDQTQPKIVIEGLITNQPDQQYIKIARSLDFYDSGKAPAITNATVLVTDDLDNEFVFEHDFDSVGYYFPQTPFVGEVGRTYHMKVVIDGKTYEAEDKMPAVTPIDTLKYRINDDQKEDPKEKNKIYEIQLFAKEPQATTDFYLFKFYRNDSIKFDSDTDIYTVDDEFLSDHFDGIPSPVYFGIGDKVRVEMYSISHNAYIFYSDLSILINNDGGLFGSPPANCRTNLTNGALGFFQVSALNSKELMIE